MMLMEAVSKPSPGLNLPAWGGMGPRVSILKMLNGFPAIAGATGRIVQQALVNEKAPEQAKQPEIVQPRYQLNEPFARRYTEYGA